MHQINQRITTTTTETTAATTTTMTTTSRDARTAPHCTALHCTLSLHRTHTARLSTFRHTSLPPLAHSLSLSFSQSQSYTRRARDSSPPSPPPPPPLSVLCSRTTLLRGTSSRHFGEIVTPPDIYRSPLRCFRDVYRLFSFVARDLEENPGSRSIFTFKMDGAPL